MNFFIFADTTQNRSRTLLSAYRHIYIWLTRFRHRRGYGVHSPFAFGFITQVIYEKAAYYAYQDIPVRLKNLEQKKQDSWKREPEKINRLLFRLVNYARPAVIWDAGPPSSAMFYLQAARRQATYIPLISDRMPAGCPDGTADFIYLHPDDTSDMQQLFHVCLSHITSSSLMVVRDIHRDSRMKRLWQQMKEEEKVGITFDLYDVGILFFDRSRVKQHYIVNF